MSAIFWRFYWLVPLPLFAGLFCCIRLVSATPCSAMDRVRRLCQCPLLSQRYLKKRIFDKTNQTTISAPGLKVPSFYEDIMEIAAHFGSQTQFSCLPNSPHG